MNRLLGIISSRPITTTIFVVCCCFLMGDVWQRWWQVTPSLHLQSTASRSHEGLVAQRVVTPVGQVQPLEASPGFLPIEEIRVGMRVPASNPELTEADRAMFPNPDPASWRLLEMEQTKASGGLLRISMLRPIAWVHQRDMHQGGTFELALPEMGAVGPAEVLAIKPCPEIATGPGDVVLSTFVHPASEQLVDVTIGDGEFRETISVTENHPFWSPEKNAFIPIGHFQSGDQLLTRDQQLKKITSLLARPGPPTDVYNLEVNGGHVYYVGQLELLVHNSYYDDIYDLPLKTKVQAGVARPPRHHIFPQEFRLWFEERGVNIDRFAIEMSQGEHSALHTMLWNEKLFDLLEAKEAILKRKLTVREIWQVGYRFCREFELRDFDIIDY